MQTDAFANWDAERRQLHVGNAKIARRWELDVEGRLLAVSLLDRTKGAEWLLQPRRKAPAPVARLSHPPRAAEFHVEPAPGGICATLTATGESSRLTYRFQVRTGVAAVTQSFRAQGDRAAPAASEPRDLMESLTLAPLHLRLTQAELRDGSDFCNELLQEPEWLLHPSERELRLQGCLFAIEDVLSGAGVTLLKHAPLPDARPHRSAVDLIAWGADRSLELLGHGVDAGDEGWGYSWSVVLSQGGAPGRTAALQALQRSIRPYRRGRDGLLVANTWGDRNRDGRIEAAFVAAEIAAAQALGVEVVQIDDGWQKGTTENSVKPGGVWQGFHAADPEFWAVNAQRFPQGLGPLAAQAKQAGIRLGLWYAPDSASDFKHWRDDADRVRQLRSEFAIEHFKLDSVNFTSKTGERNFHALVDEILESSNGEAVLDIDITADVRSGYFGRMDCGPLFVENRYTDTHKYWPHFTLRNLWRLAHYVNPLRLRMEWLNNGRNLDAYADDPLAPSRYRMDYLFATVMFSSPLAWFELSHLPPSSCAEVAPLIAIWKAHRDEIFSGVILPIGSPPDGIAWTGFLAVSPDRQSGYLLAFRELSGEAEADLATPLASFSTAEILVGEGQVSCNGSHARVSIPDPLRFVLARVSA